MSAYEILKQLNKYALLIEHMATVDWPCECTEDTTCTYCHQRDLYEMLNGIMSKAGKYVF